MKKTILIPALLASLSLTSCVVVDSGADGKPAPVAGESDAGPAGWQSGYEKGLSDGRNGLSRTPDRYSYIYSQADRADFFRGYESGYNRGIQ